MRVPAGSHRRETSRSTTMPLPMRTAYPSIRNHAKTAIDYRASSQKIIPVQFVASAKPLISGRHARSIPQPRWTICHAVLKINNRDVRVPAPKKSYNDVPVAGCSFGLVAKERGRSCSDGVFDRDHNIWMSTNVLGIQAATDAPIIRISEWIACHFAVKIVDLVRTKRI